MTSKALKLFLCKVWYATLNTRFYHGSTKPRTFVNSLIETVVHSVSFCGMTGLVLWTVTIVMSRVAWLMWMCRDVAGIAQSCGLFWNTQSADVIVVHRAWRAGMIYVFRVYRSSSDRTRSDPMIDISCACEWHWLVWYNSIWYANIVFCRRKYWFMFPTLKRVFVILWRQYG